MTYGVAILCGVLVGRWAAGLQHALCPPGPSTGQCIPVPVLSTWDAALVGLASAVAVVSCAIAVEVMVRRRR